MFAHIRSLFSRRQRLKLRSRQVFPLRARYDAAQTTEDNKRYWAAADALSADAANSPEDRRIVRNRARYEVANNSYARGIVLTLANDLIGTGPRLQMTLPGAPETNQLIEREFAAWAQAIDLPGKLRVMACAKIVDGEAFALLKTNPEIDHAVKLDLLPIEADRVTTPDLWVRDRRNLVDGILLDQYDNPVEYHVLKEHPGNNFNWSVEYDRVPARNVIHYFRQDRPEQHRGISEIMPALPLFAQLRRYTLAVIAAAETAADFAVVIYTDSPPDGEAADCEPMDLVELEKRMATVLPGGWKISQIQAQQPTTTYADFKREILNEIARCLNMPRNIATGDSSGYNYASGRLDHQTYFKSIRVEQNLLSRSVLDRILRAWLEEAALVPELLSRELKRTVFRELSHQWFFDGHEHVDPVKEANAQRVRLLNHTTTLAHEFARQGRDWETELEQRAREIAKAKELGLPMPWETYLPQEAPEPQESEEV